MNVYLVRNIAMEIGGIFSTREKAENRTRELYEELYGEKWFVIEIEVDYYCDKRKGWLSDK